MRALEIDDLNEEAVYLVVNAKDLRDFGVKAGIWSVVGATVMVGYAWWWERGEDDRKEARRWKKEAKELKQRRESQAKWEAQKAAKKA
jgi:F0F1-type ATP synthase epsilon subunit